MPSNPTTVLDKVLELSNLISADLDQFLADSGLTTARVHLLWVLGLSGPSTQQSLAAALDVTPRNVTGLVDALVESGHVTREPHPTDRRAILVTPTKLGKKAIDQLRASHTELAQVLFGDVPARRLAMFEKTLDETITTFAQLMKEES